jgi:hypothetical protein
MAALDPALRLLIFGGDSSLGNALVRAAFRQYWGSGCKPVYYLGGPFYLNTLCVSLMSGPGTVRLCFILLRALWAAAHGVLVCVLFLVPS